MDYTLDDVLNYIGFKSGIPRRWGYTKISNKLSEYGLDYGKKFDNDELFYDLNGPEDNEGRYFVSMFGESFKPQELYYILKDILEENGLTDILESMIINNAEEYETDLIESLPNLKQQLVDTKKVLAGKYNKVEDYLAKAFTKFITGNEIRNALDDLRFALEQLLQVIYKNNQTLENNITRLRKDIKDKDIEPHVASMVGTLLTLYPDYQNANVKHNDTFNSNCAEFIFDITATIIKLIVKIL